MIAKGSGVGRRLTTKGYQEISQRTLSGIDTALYPDCGDGYMNIGSMIIPMFSFWFDTELYYTRWYQKGRLDEEYITTSCESGVI